MDKLDKIIGYTKKIVIFCIFATIILAFIGGLIYLILLILAF